MGMQRRTPLWLSHHYPHEYDRCIRVGDSHICRRCSVFYPVTFAVMFATLAGLRWPRGLGRVAAVAVARAGGHRMVTRTPRPGSATRPAATRHSRSSVRRRWESGWPGT